MYNVPPPPSAALIPLTSVTSEAGPAVYVYSVTILATVAYDLTSSASSRQMEDLASSGRRRFSASSARAWAAVLPSLPTAEPPAVDAADDELALLVSVPCRGGKMSGESDRSDRICDIRWIRSHFCHKEKKICNTYTWSSLSFDGPYDMSVAANVNYENSTKRQIGPALVHSQHPRSSLHSCRSSAPSVSPEIGRRR